VQSATGTPGGGKTMGMAYGFSNDENPTPPATNPPQPEVPSKLDQTVAYGGSGNTITFGPWITTGTNPTLSVVVSPPAGGSVTSSPAGIACEPTCSRAYASGTPVTLTATPAAGYVFTGWSGVCSGSSTTCALVVNGTASAFAQFAPAGGSTNVLTVVVSGPGAVASAPPGINCGSACSAAFTTGTPVTLTATPQPGATFFGWTGACSGSASTCVVTMSAARSVGATFVAASQVVLSVTTTVGGTVTSVPAGINCGTTCAAGFALGTAVNVVATPSPGYRFVGWAGACSGSNVCDVVMDANKSVSASFASIAPAQFPLTVIDFGNGTVVSSPPGIDCGTTCATVFPAGLPVTLTATPAPGNVFAGWGGACTGLGTCVVFMDDVVNVSARFLPNAPPPVQQVPTLSEWGLLLLAMLLMLAAGARLRGKTGRGERI
jgi:hypothetical protein